MAGVFGVVGQPGAPGLHGRLSAMAARLRHHCWYQESIQSDEANGVGLGRVSLGPAPAVADHRGPIDNQVLFAFLEGEILDYAEHRRFLEAVGQRFIGHDAAELIARGIAVDGPAFCRRLHGKFAAAAWDATARRLVLVNDRFGMKPLYYVRRPGQLLFASEIKALFANPTVLRRADLRGVAQFFTFGQLLGEGTMFDGVRLLPAAGILLYEPDADRLTLDRYWRLQSRPTTRPAPRPWTGLTPPSAEQSSAAPPIRPDSGCLCPAEWMHGRSLPSPPGPTARLPHSAWAWTAARTTILPPRWRR